jgi:hypothetical protein
VVLGAKGRNTLGARLGSTVHAVLHHARGKASQPSRRTGVVHP